MTRSERRKAASQERLKASGIPINSHLPHIESEEEVTLRAVEEIAQRAFVLCGVSMRGDGVDRQRVLSFLHETGVWDATSPVERQFLLDERPSPEETRKAGWRYESLWTLLWALGRVEELGPPTSMCDVPRAHAGMQCPGCRKYMPGIEMRDLAAVPCSPVRL